MTDAPPSVPSVRPLVSLVFRVLDEREHVEALVAPFPEIQADNPGHVFELVLMDDGSTDGTPEVGQTAFAQGERLAIVRLARDFGSQYAFSAGLCRARRQCAIVVGADLQEPLGLVRKLLKSPAWQTSAEVSAR